jgi:hypothetical protein
MQKFGLIRVGTRVATFLAAICMLTECGAPTSSGPGTGGTNGTGTGGTNSSGGTTGAGGSTGAGGTGGTTGTGGSTGGGGSVSTGGTTGKGGSTATGGSPATGGTPGNGGSTGTGGAPATGGAPGTGGTPGTGGMTTTTDPGGVPLATLSSGCLSGKPPTGPTPPASPYYFNLGDIRLINNQWGSDALGCSGTQQSVCINSDGTIGWKFNRPACGGMRGDPDFPEVEFGVAPFGNTSSLLTTPTYSSTTLLPIQIGNLNTATLGLSSYSTNITSTLSSSYWDGNFEFWISRDDPTKTANAGVYAEIIMFMNYEPNRTSSSGGGWTCDHSGTVTAGSYTFNLCHQADNWSNNQWRFFNFNLSGATSNATNTPSNGTADIKAILSWVMSTYGNSTASSGGGAGAFSNSMYLTRIEVGTEVDDNTAGSVKISNLSFNINGTTKGITFGH